jgi:sulfatase modifying factor 1
VKDCCTPGGGRPQLFPLNVSTPQRGERDVRRGMVLIPGGTFWMGSQDEDTFPDDGEGPVREVSVDDFHIDPKAVTNAQFATFVKRTGYLTEAERFGWSFVFHHFVTGKARAKVLDAHVPAAPL